MKYKLINKTTQEEHICSKVVIDGFDYYIDDSFFTENDLYIDTGNNSLRHGSNNHTIGGYKKKVIATTNPDIDVPKVVDEIEEMVKNHHENSNRIIGFLNGYNKSQETHSFTEEDMIEFSWWLVKNLGRFSCDQTAHFTKEYLKIWEEQQIKTVYYE